MPIDVELVLNLFLTYLVHSTLLFTAAWLLTRTVLRERAGWSEVIWRVALVGGLVTTALPASGHLSPVSTPTWTLPSIIELTSSPPSEPMRAIAAEPTLLHSEASPAFDWREVAVFAIVGLSGLALVMFLGSCFRVRRGLVQRQAIDDPELIAMLRDLERSAGLRRPLGLSRSEVLASPIALGPPLLGLPWLGVRRGEVVLPSGIEERLSPSALRGVLAHEVAHHRWRDPLWRVIDRAIVAIGFVQPLHRIAARRLAELAEFRCDAWAVEATDSPESFADGLATVAAWLSGLDAPRRRSSATIAAMAVRPSTLARRIDQVLDRPRGRRTRLRPLTLVASLMVPPLLAPALPSFESGAATRGQSITAAEVPAPTGAVADSLWWIGRELQAIDRDLAELRGAPADPSLSRLRDTLRAKRAELAARRDSLARRFSPEAQRNHSGPDSLPSR